MQDGHTYREHCERAAFLSARAREELQGPELPPGCGYVWTWFCELHAARGGNGYGPNPISYAEIEAWARLTGRHLTPWEVAALRVLDQVWMVEPDMGAGT